MQKVQHKMQKVQHKKQTDKCMNHHSFFSLLIGRHLLLGLDQLHHSGLNGFKSLLFLLNNLLQF
jgi:hypothetical protein